MGIDYSYNLCMGFEVPEGTVHAKFRKTEEFPGTFHMEDRYDPKTGTKLEQVKVWDQKPTSVTWYEVDGQKYTDPETECWEDILSEKFGCHVETYGCYLSGELNFVFDVSAQVSYKDARSEGRITFYNESLSCEEVFRLMPAALILQSRLEEAGFKVGKPRIFLAERVI